MARQIQTATGADLFEIIPAKLYPEAYQDVVDQAKEEINAGFHPELKTNIASVADYDVIFIGSPIWWGTIAPPVAAFLSSHDLTGKTVIPFMTHEGSRRGHSVSDIKKLCPNSTVLDGLPIRGHSVRNSQKEVTQWINKIQAVK
ncbi:MAG: hypothetical protein PWQ29_1056 [Verrucomicrobiota bacterium]|jgi:flavodoxin|nr:hypothetical protein [Verrucomicrobiota bacterium]